MLMLKHRAIKSTVVHLFAYGLTCAAGVCAAVGFAFLVR